MWHTDMWRSGDWVWGGWAMPVIWIVVVAAVVIGVVFLVRALNRDRQTSVAQAAVGRSGLASDDPREILKRRYAAGEIDRDEYLQKRDDLSP